jgi:hypothetical protein
VQIRTAVLNPNVERLLVAGRVTVDHVGDEDLVLGDAGDGETVVE